MKGDPGLSISSDSIQIFKKEEEEEEEEKKKEKKKKEIKKS